MSQSINHQPLNEAEVEQLYQNAANRQANTGVGLSQGSIGALQSMHAIGGGVMMRAAAGNLGAQVTARRVLHLMIALDGSGSMSNQRGEVVAGINQMIADLADPRSKERESFEVSIWIFSNTEAKLLTVENPDFNNAQPESDSNPRRIEVANLPVTLMPPMKIADYETDGITPMNKTLLMMMGSGSLRAERLRLGVNGQNKRAAMTYLVLCGDGLNNVWQEHTKAGTLEYKDAIVQGVSRDLLTTEQWILAVAYSGTDLSAEQVAKNIGFNVWQDVSAGGWRKLFGVVSQSAQNASRAATASQATGGGNSFIS